jgi:hypothetical protein
MGCTEVADHVVRIHDVLMRDRVALEGSLFHSGMLGFTSDMRDPLLDFQYDLYTGHPWLSKSVGMLERWAFSHFVRDVDKAFSVR